jgi:CRISPR-associated protein Cas5h
MESLKKQPVLLFDLFADYAQLKKYYTTMSPLSFAIPPGTVIRGMLGALIGIDKEISPEYFHDVDISMRVINPIKKVVIPENLLKTLSKKHFSRFENHKPTNIEFVKDVRYRIYLKTENVEIYEHIKKYLFNHSSVYTLSIGISEALANFENVAETNIESSLSGKNIIHSIIPTDFITSASEITFDDVEIFTVKLPMKMKNDREVIEYREFAYERKGHPIEAKIDEAVSLSNGEHVVFF